MGKKTGRPKKPISKRQFEELCQIQCTREEICAVLDVSEKTIDKWCNETYGKAFSLVFAEKRQGGRTSLRRKQWNLAETNSTMAIWLGKQYLDQKDNVDEINIKTAKEKVTIEIVGLDGTENGEN